MCDECKIVCKTDQNLKELLFNDTIRILYVIEALKLKRFLSVVQENNLYDLKTVV